MASFFSCQPVVCLAIFTSLIVKEHTKEKGELYYEIHQRHEEAI